MEGMTTAPAETPNKLSVWGISSAIDIYDCDPEKIRNPELIRQFAIDLCDFIEMVRAGDTQVVYFGGENHPGPGFSMVQMIETSLISAHFADDINTAYMDIFSCKLYDPEKVRAFAQEYFGGKRSTLNVTHRI